MFLFMLFSDKPYVIWKDSFVTPCSDKKFAGVEDSEKERRLLSSQFGEGHGEVGRQAVRNWNSGIS